MGLYYHYDIEVTFVDGGFSRYWSIYPPEYKNGICTINNESGVITDIPIGSIKYVTYKMTEEDGQRRKE